MPGQIMSRLRALWARLPHRALFIVYAIALFTLTHWPHLSVGEPGGPRIDLPIHLVAFGVWTFLLAASGLVGPTHARPTHVRAAIVAIIYAAFDELTQGIPGLGRQVVLSDITANILGVACGFVGSLVLLPRLTQPSNSTE